VTTFPRDGNGRKPWTAAGSLVLLVVDGGDWVRACRKRCEITRPAVVPPPAGRRPATPGKLLGSQQNIVFDIECGTHEHSPYE